MQLRTKKQLILIHHLNYEKRENILLKKGHKKGLAFIVAKTLKYITSPSLKLQSYTKYLRLNLVFM